MTVPRVRPDGRVVRTPVVAQATLEGGVDFQANTGGVLKPLGGIEAERTQAILTDRIDPKVAAAARRQRAAIGRHYAKRNLP